MYYYNLFVWVLCLSYLFHLYGMLLPGDPSEMAELQNHFGNENAILEAFLPLHILVAF